MTSTPKLLPLLSSSTPIDESPFFSASSIGKSPLLKITTCLPPEPSELAIWADTLCRENPPSPYTLHLIYPDISESTPLTPDSSFERATNIPWAQPNTPGSDVASSAKHWRNPCQHRSRSSGLQPESPDKKFRLPSHPSLVKFPETLPLNKSQLHGLRSPHPNSISATKGTEALISLAWTGEVSSSTVASGYALSRIGDTYMWPKLRISEAEVNSVLRTSFHPKDDVQGATCGYKEQKNAQQRTQSSPIDDSQTDSQPERWTLADAISDDQVTDEMFVELLEEFRSCHLRSTTRSTFRFLPDMLSSTEEILDYKDTGSLDGVSYPPRLPDVIPLDAPPAWAIARRAILVCRELIHTERHYLASLNILLAGETEPPPPPLMASRLPALVDASNRFVSLMETNPSVTGVCTAFIQVFEQLEKAFVQWCEVVGHFFSSDPVGNPGTLIKCPNSGPAPPKSVAGGKTLLPKSLSSWSKIQPRALEEIASIAARNPRSKSQLKFLVRDLAILPTQRITRYVLLFKDLLFHSPPLDIKSTVERATGAAIVLAEKADRAQNHAAFQTVPST